MLWKILNPVLETRYGDAYPNHRDNNWRKCMGIEPTGEISHPPHRF